MDKLQPEYKDKLNKFKIKMEEYTLIKKLIGEDIKLLTDSILPYDSYDWQSPICPAYRIISDNLNLTIGINPNDGEIIIEMYSHMFQEKYLELNEYLICHDSINNSQRYITQKYLNGFNCYILNHDDIIKKILKLCLI